MPWRTHRAGGLTTQGLAVRGRRQLLPLRRGGGELELLWVGKIAAPPIPLSREVRWRGVFLPPPLIPRYLERPDVRARLARLRQSTSVLDLCEGSKR